MDFDNYINIQIERIKEKCEIIKPLVAIQCITYNHEKYLMDALNGFMMQKTDFPFVAIVHEDASTDGTANVLREFAEKYPNIILPIFEKENQYSKKDGSLRRIIDKACEVTGAKYIAICEGDDYWTDSLKLQKQVNFLKNHPDYGLCYSKAASLIQNSHKIDEVFGGNSESFDQLIIRNVIPTLTVIIRSNIYYEFTKEIATNTHNWLMMDYPLWLFAAAKTKIKFLNIVTGIYRVVKDSASHSTDYLRQLIFVESNCKIRSFYSKQAKNKNYKLINEIELDELKAQLKIVLYKRGNSRNIRNKIKNICLKKNISLSKKVKLLPWIICASVSARISYIIWKYKRKNW